MNSHCLQKISIIYIMNMKNILTAYVLAIIGLITPVAGLHRFYLNKKISGFFYLCTYGFFTIGTIIDLIRMPSLLGSVEF